MFYLVIILYLLGVLCVQVKRSAVHIERLKALRIPFEVLLILSCVILPGLVMWIPLYVKRYALDNGPCFFHKISKLCNTSKHYFLYIFSAIPSDMSW